MVPPRPPIFLGRLPQYSRYVLVSSLISEETKRTKLIGPPIIVTGEHLRDLVLTFELTSPHKRVVIATLQNEVVSYDTKMLN